ncbi:MAG TPA: hypothetical protein VK489_05525, partial [Ferruginibacter sp.]|nr:hypothetical protein [Ferruginibacter sp.]
YFTEIYKINGYNQDIPSGSTLSRGCSNVATKDGANVEKIQHREHYFYPVKEINSLNPLQKILARF